MPVSFSFFGGLRASRGNTEGRITLSAMHRLVYLCFSLVFEHVCLRSRDFMGTRASSRHDFSS